MTELKVKNLKVNYYTPFGNITAVDDISFKLSEGQSLGIAGESGCGKTTSALSIMKLLPVGGKVVSGKIYLENNLLEMTDEQFRKEIRWKRISMIFQGSMNALNPLQKVGFQIAEPIIYHGGYNKKEALKKALDLVELVGIDHSRANSYPFELSGGMRQRIMIAMSLACNPEIVIADEPTTALDVIVSRQIITLLKNLQKTLNLSLILITHDLSVIAQLCDTLAIMYAGKIVELTDIYNAFKNPMHPYTSYLMNAFPNLKGEKKYVKEIPGSPPNLMEPQIGCRFSPRCLYAEDICKKQEPDLIEEEKNHLVSCHFAKDKIIRREKFD